MPDKIDFHVSDTIAVGHDELQHIIFRALKKDSGKAKLLRWDGQAWQAVYFVHISKAVLLRALRELGVSPACLEAWLLRSMPEDLREYRKRRLVSPHALSPLARECEDAA